MAEVYTVHYFACKGRAEPIRMLLSYAGVEWKDNRFPYSEPPNIPPEVKSNAPYGTVPLLEVNGQYLAETVAIARFLGRKFKLNGANEWENAKCDEFVDAVTDFSRLFEKAWYEHDEEKKKEIAKEAAKKGSEKFVSYFNAVLSANGGHLVGQQLTWADIYVAFTLEYYGTLFGAPVLEGFPAVEKLVDTVLNAKGIKEWIGKRPVTKV